MEDAEKIITRLQNEIKLRDKDIHLAATYGKQLFEGKAELNLKFEELNSVKEALEQDKHSLQLELETQNQTVRSLTTELEFQRDKADDFLEKLHSNEKENVAMHKKIQNLLKENQYFKKQQEDLTVENKSLQDKICLQEKQIKNFEDLAEKSFETEKDENTELLAQLNTYMLNIKEVQDALSQAQCELQMAKKNENHLLQMVKDLEEAVSDRDADIRTYMAELKKTKEEMEELLAEMEVLKFDQVDTNRRGNSVFAELDDRRTMVEKEYKLLQKKFEYFKKNYEVNKTELDRARGQMAILQSMASRDYQQTYIDKLEDSLSAAKQEIQNLTHKLSKVIKNNVEIVIEDQKFSKENEYGYLRVMLKQSQIKEKELQNEVMNIRMKNMYDNDKLTETQHVLYKAKEDLDSAKQEISKLKLKIKEIEQGIYENKSYDKEPRKPNIEVFEGFKPKSTGGKNEKLNKSIINFHPDMSMIPGELEWDDDDGFRQIRPPRKSNKFILQEFNRLETDEENNKNVSICTGKNELKGRNEEKEQIDQNERLRLKNRSHTKVSSRRDDNCKQQ